MSNSIDRRVFEKIGIKNRLGREVSQVENKEREMKWEVVSNPTRLIRTYKFSDYNALQQFVCEVLDFQGDLNHHGSLSVKSEEVIVEVYTHDINDITEIDFEYSRSVEEIYLDIEDRQSRW